MFRLFLFIRSYLRPILVASAGVIGLTSPAFALGPEQIAILVARNNPDSRRVAEHYVEARHIPADHIIEIPTDTGPVREHDYRTVIVPLIRQTLTDRKLDKQITCLVTTYGIPLSIGATVPTAAEQEEITTYRHELIDALEELKTATAAYQAILALPSTTSPVVPPPATGPATTHAREPEIAPIPQLEKQLKAAVDAARQRINAATGSFHQNAMAEFIQIHQRVAGIAGVATLVHVNADVPRAAATEQKWNQIAQEIADGQKRYEGLFAVRDKPENRREMIDLCRRFHGIGGAVSELQQQIAYLQGDQSEAAFDSELMMLWINGYPRTRWLTNPMHLTRWLYLPNRADPPRVMMVSRLDGLTADKVNGMIDQSLKTEAAGLDGVVYFDARGLHQMDDYSQFDADLRLAASYLRDNTDMKVVLDDRPQLLQAANCPNAALYCGWYSVHSYQDSCQWLPGSVAYHVASFELTGLHDPAETGWCSNLLRRGVCGTLGPVTEPYLFSFPKPSEFFPLLVSGLFTQAEVFYLTVPNTSWRIAYVGDPLYNPFKNKPRLSIAKIRAHSILRNALVEMGIDAPGPTSATAPATGR